MHGRKNFSLAQLFHGTDGGVMYHYGGRLPCRLRPVPITLTNLVVILQSGCLVRTGDR